MAAGVSPTCRYVTCLFWRRNLTTEEDGAGDQFPDQPGAFGMTPGCVAVCSWRRLLASRHLPLPFPRTISLHRRRCPSAYHHLVPSLSLPGLSLPPYSTFFFHQPWRGRGGGGLPAYVRQNDDRVAVIILRYIVRGKEVPAGGGGISWACLSPTRSSQCTKQV